MKVSENKVAFFDGLYRNALEKHGNLFAKLEAAYQQYRDGGDGEGHRPYETVRNVTYELVESQVSVNIPSPSVDSASLSEVKVKNARRITTLLSALRDRLPFEKMNELEERYTYIYGGSLFLVEWDDSLSRFGEVGGIRVTAIDPMQFVPQPDIHEIGDMEYCFLVFDTTEDELARRYHLTEGDLSRLERRDDDGAVTTVVAFYKNERGEVSRFIWSGEVMLSHLDDYYARKERVCKVCGKSERYCLCETPELTLVSREAELLSEDIATDDGRVIPKGSAIPYYRPHGFPLVLRRNTPTEEGYLGLSDCLVISHQQREINKVLSRVHEKLMMAGIYPYKPDDCQFRFDNSVGGKVLNLRPGEDPRQFGVLDTTPDISRDLDYLSRIYDDAKRILGISDAYVGGESFAAESGKAKEIRVAQAEGRLASKRVLKNAAYAELDRMIFEFYLAYADEPRRLVRRDRYGGVEADAFCRYDFLVYDEALQAYRYDDDYLFSVAPAKPDKDQREALWSGNLDNYKEGMFGKVGETETLMRYWAAQARCGYPGAEENLNYFTQSLDKA